MQGKCPKYHQNMSVIYLLLASVLVMLFFNSIVGNRQKVVALVLLSECRMLQVFNCCAMAVPMLA